MIDDQHPVFILNPHSLGHELERVNYHPVARLASKRLVVNCGEPGFRRFASFGHWGNVVVCIGSVPDWLDVFREPPPRNHHIDEHSLRARVWRCICQSQKFQRISAIILGTQRQPHQPTNATTPVRSILRSLSGKSRRWLAISDECCSCAADFRWVWLFST